MRCGFVVSKAKSPKLFSEATPSVTPVLLAVVLPIKTYEYLI